MTDPTRTQGDFQSLDGRHANQLQRQDNDHLIDPGLLHLQSCLDHPSSRSTNSLEAPSFGYPTSAPPRYCQHFQSSSIMMDNHSTPYCTPRLSSSSFSISATLGDAPHYAYNPTNQQQAPIQYTAAPTSGPYPGPIPSVYLPLGRLFVTMLGARDIVHNTGRIFCKNSEKTNFYGVIKFGGKYFGTEESTSIQEGSHPQWNQIFSFYVMEQDPEHNELSITLYNRSKLRRDDVLGQFKILNLGQYMLENRNNIVGWHPLYLNGEQNGEVLLDFSFISMQMGDILKALSRSRAGASRGASATSSNAKYSSSMLNVGTVIAVVVHGVSIMVPLMIS